MLDAMIFLSPSKEDVDNLKEILRIFGEVTGLIINISKSVVISIQCQSLQLDEILENFLANRLQLPCNYLRLPLTRRKPRKVVFQPLLDKVHARLSGYKRNMLSWVGRLVVLNAVITAIPMYHLTATELPAWTIKQIDKHRRAWFWTGDDICAGGKCWVNWRMVCHPKKVRWPRGPVPRAV